MVLEGEGPPRVAVPDQEARDGNGEALGADGGREVAHRAPLCGGLGLRRQAKC